MADEEKKEEVTKTEEEKETPKAKGGMMKMILLGVVALVIVAGAVFGTLMIVGGDTQVSEVAVEDASQEGEAQADGSHDNHDSEDAEEHGETADIDMDEAMLESLMISEDPEVLERIMENLSILDFEPEEIDLGEEEEMMSKEDSIEAVHWLEEEKAKLAKREESVLAREKALSKLDKEVTKKVLRIEQVESNRVSNLAKLYDGMDPRSVAKLMANLDDGTVVSILPRMKTKNASALLQLLPPKRAARLSKQMITIAEN